MDDSWSFRTERGRAWVAGGTLRIRGSFVGVARSTVRDRWTDARPVVKALYLFSFAGTAAWFGRVLTALETLVGPDAVSGIQWFTLAATALVALVVAWQTVGHSERIPLARVESVRRADRTLTVEYADPDDGDRTLDLRALVDRDRSLELTALTDQDADRAAEALRLKGVRVEDRTGDAPEDGSDSGGVRDDDVTYDVLGRQS